MAIEIQTHVSQPTNKTTVDAMPLIWVSAVTRTQLKAKLDAMQFSCVCARPPFSFRH